MHGTVGAIVISICPFTPVYTGQIWCRKSRRGSNERKHVF